MHWSMPESCYRGPCARLVIHRSAVEYRAPLDNYVTPEGVRLYTGSIFRARVAAFRTSHSGFKLSQSH